MPELRRKVHRNLLTATIFLALLSIFVWAVAANPVTLIPGLHVVTLLAPKLYGLFLLVFAVTFVFSSFEALHRSYYFQGLTQVLKESTDPDHLAASYEVATIVSETNDDDITGGFMESTYGQEILYRAGLNSSTFETFLEDRTPTVTAETFVLEQDAGVVLETYARSVYKHDKAFRDLLSRSGINGDQLARAAAWVTSIERRDRRAKRWWSRDNLGRIPGLGKSWSYGVTFYLERYGHDIVDDHIWSTAMMTRRAEADEVDELEQILARARQSNALMIGDNMTDIRQRAAQLEHRIREGLALPPLEGKRTFMLDIESILAMKEDKAAIERTIRETLNQAVHAGNIIVYLEHFTGTIKSVKALGIDLVGALQPFMESSSIQLIAGSTKSGFNEILTRDKRVTQAFDMVHMREAGQEGLLDLLEQRATVRERETGVVFSITALEAVANLADRYFPTGVLADKSFDLLEELVPYALAHGIDQILKEHVEKLVTDKSHVPVGEPSEEEREKLLSLEDYLHRRVIAQEQAIAAVAKALRRARAGVGSGKKPIGSFLFLGPTGVGKTETAKALAEALFNDENAMLRLDMSEFQGEDALDELIGSFETGQPGRLPTLIRSQQYGVLLLDEFEKSNKDVHDLFLQILDEGHFTDHAGDRVDTRNLVIIATSNAGAKLIWEWEKQGKNLADQKRNLIDHLIEKRLYRPEFLNRFDDIILFHPLKPDHVKKIAKLHLDATAERIHNEQNIELAVTDELVERVAKAGYDPQFGGRPLERAIQDEVEQVLADRILEGKLKAGDTIAYTDKKD